MSDEKKLSDDLEDMIGSAKEGAKKAADKAGEFAEEAKEKAKEFAHEAKGAASEFATDAKDILSDGKNVAIIAHITIIGWIIALVMNNGDKKTEYASFYIRQMLGLAICGIILAFIPLIGWFATLVFFIFWIMSLIGSLSGDKKITPVLGQYFQDWFKSL